MHPLLRKQRGLIGIGLTWGFLCATIIVALGGIIWVVDPDSIDPGEGPLVAGAVVGFQGLVAGMGFALLLSFTETRRRILDLSLIRVALWGVLASAALPFVTGMPIGMVWFVCLLGAGSATASVAIARRSALRNPGSADLRTADSLPYQSDAS